MVTNLPGSSNRQLFGTAKALSHSRSGHTEHARLGPSSLGHYSVEAYVAKGDFSKHFKCLLTDSAKANSWFERSGVYR